MLFTEILIIALLLLLNAFFALSEMAMVSSSKPLLKQKASAGSKRAALAIELVEEPGKLLSTVQVGITLVGILAGAYGGATIAEQLAPGFNEIEYINPRGETIAFVLVVTIITYFSVIIGELIPKQIALSHPESIAMFVARPMYLLSVLCSPIVKILDLSANILMRTFGIFIDTEPQITEAEVKAVIAEGAEQGAIERTEHEMLQRIIRLGDKDVKSIMTHRLDVAFIDINSSEEDIRAKVHEVGHSRYPVIDKNNDKVIGIIQAKDLLDGVLYNKHLNIAEYVKDAPVVPSRTSCLTLLETFKSGNVHMVVVIDDHGATEGIVTIADFMEAIVGILPSNYDEGEHAQIIQRADGSWLVDGKIPVDELVLTQGLENIQLDNNYDTLAGLLLFNLNRTPHEGDIVEIFGYRFEVMDMDGKRVDKVLITKYIDISEGI